MKNKLFLLLLVPLMHNAMENPEVLKSSKYPVPTPQEIKTSFTNCKTYFSSLSDLLRSIKNDDVMRVGYSRNFSTMNTDIGATLSVEESQLLQASIALSSDINRYCSDAIFIIKTLTNNYQHYSIEAALPHLSKLKEAIEKEQKSTIKCLGFEAFARELNKDH